MMPKKKTVLYLIYILVAINTFLLAALLMIFFQTSLSKNQPRSAGSTAEVKVPTVLVPTPLVVPTSSAHEALPPEAGKGEATEETIGTGEPSGSEAVPVEATPELVSGPSTIFFPVARLVIPPPFVAKNVIVFIGDGMGLEHVKAGSMYAYGATGEMPFEHFPYHALMRTGSNNGLTDSAAAATAMATGHKVDNKVISLAIPGNGRGYSTVLEYASKHEMSTGLVTTTPITNATPASFGAHAESREHYAKIAQDYLEVSRPNVLFGGGSSDITEERASAAGYQVITNRDEMLALDTETQTRVSGQFGAGYIPYESSGLGDQPHLSEMTAVALRILDNDPDGFFVMIEGGRIDTAAHDNDAEAMVGEMAEFGRSVQAAMDWAQGRDDTLIIVLADHETGGLQVVQNNGQGVVPDLSWSTSGHTGVDVGMWAYGKPLSGLSERIDNTEIPRIITAGEFYNR